MLCVSHREEVLAAVGIFTVVLSTPPIASGDLRPPTAVIPASSQRGSIRKENQMDARLKMSGMTDVFVILACLWRGSIRKKGTQDGCPIHNVGHDGDGDGFPIHNVGNDQSREILDFLTPHSNAVSLGNGPSPHVFKSRRMLGSLTGQSLPSTLPVRIKSGHRSSESAVEKVVPSVAVISDLGSSKTPVRKNPSPNGWRHRTMGVRNPTLEAGPPSWAYISEESQ